MISGAQLLVIAGIILSAGAVFIIDVVTGSEIALSILYLIPVAAATWYLSRTAGIIVSLACAALWHVSTSMGPTVYSNDIIPYWNTTVRLGFFVIITHTLSTRKRVESELLVTRAQALEASRAKTDFVNRVTHELRTPLTAILGFSEVLERQAAPYLTPNNRECLRRIRVNADVLLRMVEGVLELGRLEAGKGAVDVEPVDLSLLLPDIVADARSRNDRVAVVLDMPPNLQLLQTNGSLLKQVIVNLLTNALKFTEDGTVRLGVEADAEGKPVTIYVHDTGIGIDSERLGTIFEPFSQADATIHRRFGGAGLGLAIARDLCDRLGCELHVQSEIGRGSRFTVVLA